MRPGRRRAQGQAVDLDECPAHDRRGFALHLRCTLLRPALQRACVEPRRGFSSPALPKHPPALVSRRSSLDKNGGERGIGSLRSGLRPAPAVHPSPARCRGPASNPVVGSHPPRCRNIRRPSFLDARPSTKVAERGGLARCARGFALHLRCTLLRPATAGLRRTPSWVLIPRAAETSARPRFSTLVPRQKWRREGDSNPRYGFWPYAGLANQCFRPLSHLSEVRKRNSRARCSRSLP